MLLNCRCGCCFPKNPSEPAQKVLLNVMSAALTGRTATSVEVCVGRQIPRDVRALALGSHDSSRWPSRSLGVVNAAQVFYFHSVRSPALISAAGSWNAAVFRRHRAPLPAGPVGDGLLGNFEMTIPNLQGGALPPFHGLGSVGVRRAFEWRPLLCCSLWRASVRSPSLLRDENNAASQAAKLGTHCGFPEPAFHQHIEPRVEGGVLRPPAGLCCCFDTIEEAAPSLFTSTAMSTENNLFPVCF